MSAFIVSDSHLDYLCAALVAYQVSVPWDDGTFRRSHDPRDDADLQAMRDALEAENVTSVNYRYRISPGESVAHRRAVRHVNRPIDPVQVMKACQCLEYQSCEHPGWPDSFAKRVLEFLNSAAINRLPGYDKADWAIGGIDGCKAA